MACIDQDIRTQMLRSLSDFSPLVPVPHWVIEASLGDIPESKDIRLFILSLHDRDGGNGKRFSAHQLCLDAEREGRIYPGATVIVPGSGNTGANIAYKRAAYGIESVIAIIDQSTVPMSKVAQLIMAGAQIAYPRPGQTTLDAARELEAMGVGTFINQYAEKGARDGQIRTMNYIIQEMEIMGQPLSFFLAAAGSTAMLCAAGERLPDAFPNIQIVGSVYREKNEPVPGARTLAAIERDISFDWRSAVGPLGLVPCDQRPSFAMSKTLLEATTRLVGPTCGLNVLGGFHRFRYHAERGELEQYRNPHGLFTMVAISMDMLMGYLGQYMDILNLEQKALFQW